MTIPYLLRVFGGCVFPILSPRNCDYENFSVKVKRPPEFSKETMATLCPRTFDHTHQKGLILSDAWNEKAT